MKQKRAGVYARVSTLDQHPEMQISTLRKYIAQRGWKLEKVYCDKGISGAIATRPALAEMMGDCHRRAIDVVVVWKFDRFARSVRHLVTALETFRTLGIDFVSYTEQIDTATATGELVFQIVASLAQFERSLISERVRAGLSHAVSKGRRLGRPPLHQLSAVELTQLRRERKRNGTPFRELARRFGVSVFTAHQVCKNPVRRHHFSNAGKHA